MVRGGPGWTQTRSGFVGVGGRLEQRSGLVGSGGGSISLGDIAGARAGSTRSSDAGRRETKVKKPILSTNTVTDTASWDARSASQTPAQRRGLHPGPARRRNRLDLDATLGRGREPQRDGHGRPALPARGRCPARAIRALGAGWAGTRAERGPPAVMAVWNLFQYSSLV